MCSPLLPKWKIRRDVLTKLVRFRYLLLKYLTEYGCDLNTAIPCSLVHLGVRELNEGPTSSTCEHRSFDWRNLLTPQ